jgi:hypothetical protein
VDKLKLDFNMLVVETFEIANLQDIRGTVDGLTGNFRASGCCDFGSDTGCDGEGRTCDASCYNGTCDPVLNTCGGCATVVHTPFACNNYSLPACTGADCTSTIHCTQPDATCGGPSCDP